MIDVEATLSVLCPQLVADLKVKSFSELGLKDFKEISDIYMNEVFPFLKEAEKNTFFCGLMNREEYRNFVIKWNNTFPIDRWFRNKHNIPFLSEEHKGVISLLNLWSSKKKRHL